MDSAHETIMIPLLTFDEYEKQRKQRFNKLWLKLKEEYIAKLAALLIQHPYNYTETTAGELAEDLLHPDSQFFLNAEVGSADDETELSVYREKWQQTVKEQLLMLRLPVNKRRHPWHKDDETRKQQNEEFITRYRGNPRVRHQRIMNRDELFARIRHFLLQDCDTTGLATIVFNGHGSPDGLSVYIGEPIPLNDIITHVHHTLYAMNRNIQMPRAVDIVVGQCHGHLHSCDEDPNNFINVISLTTEDKPKTIQNIKIGPSTGKTNHYELENYAQRRNRLGPQTLTSAPEVQATGSEDDTDTSLEGAVGGHV